MVSLNSEVEKLIRREIGFKLKRELNKRGLVWTTIGDGDETFFVNVRKQGKITRFKYDIGTEILQFNGGKHSIKPDDVPIEIERLSENPMKTDGGGKWQYYLDKNKAVYHDFVSGLVLGFTSDNLYIHVSVIGKEYPKYTFLKSLYNTKKILEAIEDNWFKNSVRKKLRKLLSDNNIDYREINGDFWFSNYSYAYNPETKIIYEHKKWPLQLLHYKMPFKDFLLRRILRTWKQPYKTRLEKYVVY